MRVVEPAGPNLLAIADGLDRLVLWARRSTPAQMSSTSITTLDTLDRDGPLRVTELAQREGVSQPGMTTLVNRLVGQGYAERLPDPRDRRAALVRITPAGRDMLRARQRSRSVALHTVIARLPHEHQAALGAVVDALHALTQTPPDIETRAR